MPRVLIADDEDSMRTLVARAIAMDGHETVTAATRVALPRPIDSTRLLPPKLELLPTVR